MEDRPIRLVDDSAESQAGPDAGYVRREIDLSIRDETLHVALDVAEDRQARLAEAVPVIHQIDDRIVQVCLATGAAEGKHVQCRKGCQVCCHSYLLVFSLAEMYFLMELLDRKEPGRAEKARAWLSRHAAEFRRAGMLERLRNLGRRENPLDVIRQWWLEQADTVCPFLDTDEGACGMYEDRFVCCREFYSLLSPDHCARHETARLAVLPSLVNVPSELEGRLTGEPVGAITMPDLMLWRELRAAEARRTWPALEMADALLACLAEAADQAAALRASVTVDPSGER